MPSQSALWCFALRSINATVAASDCDVGIVGVVGAGGSLFARCPPVADLDHKVVEAAGSRSHPKQMEPPRS